MRLALQTSQDQAGSAESRSPFYVFFQAKGDMPRALSVKTKTPQGAARALKSRFKGRTKDIQRVAVFEDHEHFASALRGQRSPLYYWKPRKV